MQNQHGPFFSPDGADPQSSLGGAVTSRANYSNPPTKEDWARVQGLIRDMYVVQKLPLKDIEHALKGISFRATQRMIKQRCKTWGYQKNAKKEDWGSLAILLHERKKAGKALTIFEIHEHHRTEKDLHRFIRNQHSTYEKFLADSLGQGREVPTYIRALTPEDKHNSPPSVTDSPTDIWSPPITSATNTIHRFSLKPSVPGEQATVNTFSSTDYTPRHKEYPLASNFHQGGGSIKIQRSSQLPKSRTTAAHQQVSSCRPPKRKFCQYPQSECLEMSKQVMCRSPEPVTGQDMRSWTLIIPRTHSAGKESGYDAENVCSRCDQPSGEHFPSLDDFESRIVKQSRRSILQDSKNEHFHLPVSKPEGSWIWVSRAFLACMCFSRGDEKNGQISLDSAAHHFDIGLQKRDPLLLTAAHLMITILHTHDQDEIASRILRSAKDVVDRRLSEDDPIRITIAYYTYSANETFIENGMTSATLEAVYYKLKEQYGKLHPYTITANHNYGWFLRWENKLVEAEKRMTKACKASEKYFDKVHMQTVISRAVLAGVLRPQDERRMECIGHYRTVVADAAEILGQIHPYVLRLKWELANQLKLTGLRENEDQVVKLYKEVLWGRAKMLGRGHHFTDEARVKYEDILQDFGLWTTNGEKSQEQSEVVELYKVDLNTIESWEEVGVGEDIQMTDTSRRDEIKVEYMNDGSTRRIWVRSRSHTRTPSPTTSNEFESY